MPTPPHIEQYFTATTVRDIVIGMSDGLTVPFALAAWGNVLSRCRRSHLLSPLLL